MDAAGKAALQAAVAEGAEDPVFWLRFFLPHWFPSPLPPFHIALVALQSKQVEFLNKYPEAHEFLLEHVKYKADPNDTTSVDLPVFRRGDDGLIYMVAGEHDNWIIPRGFSKTTLTNGLNLRDIVVDGTKFLVYISKSATHAEMQLYNIRAELETNVQLRAAYGDVVPTRADLEKWQADQLQLRNGAILVARGRGGQVRGLNYRARRPNKIVLDDVEDDGTADSDTVRTATEKWFYSAVEKAGVEMEGAEGEDWAQEPLHIVNLGTLLGPECLMMTLAKDPKFNTVQFGAKLNYDDPADDRMLWPYKMSHAKYQRERERHRKVGKLAEFTRELDSSIRVSDDTIFPNVFIYEPAKIEDFAVRAIACDPAISEKKRADHAAIMVVGRRERDGAIWVLDEWGGTGKSPTEIVNQFFAMHLKWNCTHAGIETQQYQKALIFLMREEMARRQKFFVIKSILQGSDDNKVSRIQGMLSPRYMNGYIRHLRPFAGLEGNLADWPNGKKDYADATTMALTLLGESQMTVLPDGQEDRDESEYAAPEDVLPPAFRTVSNYLIPQAADPLRGRYG